jgi:plastin-1
MEAVLKQLNEKTDNVQKLIKEVDKDNNGTIEFDEFLWVIAQIRSGAADKGFANVYHKQKEMIQVRLYGITRHMLHNVYIMVLCCCSQVKGAVGVHSFAHEEMSAFAAHFNAKLSNDPDLDYLLPIQTEGTDLCTKVKDGVLLAKFINLTVRDTIDERALNKKKAKNSLFQINENLNLVISAAKSIGIITTNIGAQELLNGQQHPHLVLGLVWQLVKLQLLNQVNVKNHPELFRLLEDGEEMKDLLKLPADQLLLRWFNYHLKNANSNRRVANFGSDVCDSECYTILLNRIAPEKCNLAGLQVNTVSDYTSLVFCSPSFFEFTHSFF